jgi:hypothetical protein
MWSGLDLVLDSAAVDLGTAVLGLVGLEVMDLEAMVLEEVVLMMATLEMTVQGVVAQDANEESVVDVEDWEIWTELEEGLAEIEVDAEVTETLLEESVEEESLVDENVLLEELAGEDVILEEVVEKDVRLDELAVEDVILEDLVEDDWAKADAARAATVRIEGRNMMRHGHELVVLQVDTRAETHQCSYMSFCGGDASFRLWGWNCDIFGLNQFTDRTLTLILKWLYRRRSVIIWTWSSWRRNVKIQVHDCGS